MSHTLDGAGINTFFKIMFKFQQFTNRSIIINLKKYLKYTRLKLKMPAPQLYTP